MQTINEIAETMFMPESEYEKRQMFLGKSFQKKTIEQKLQLLNIIRKDFGECNLVDVTAIQVIKHLSTIWQNKSGSWKNRYVEVFKELYNEYEWQTGTIIARPNFPRFVNNYRKADVFDSFELKEFFKFENWRNEDERCFYMIIAGCGLRLGEARGLKVKNFLPEKQMVVIDGFCLQDGTKTDYCKCGSPANPKTRVIAVPKEIMNMITVLIHNKGLAADDWVFSRNGKPYAREFSEAFFRRALKKSGIKQNGRKLVPHSLRYTYVTQMRKVCDTETVKNIVGHTTQMMTEYYTRPQISDLMEWAENSKSAVDRLYKM